MRRSIATVGGFTLISRISGFARDMLVASLLGAGAHADAFFIAFKLPNFFRRLFAEGAFNSAFVPLFSSLLVEKGKEEARLFAQNIFSSLFFFLVVFVLFVELFMPWVVMLFAPGFHATPERLEISIFLSRITFPYILCISLAALLSGILNSVGKFSAASAAPILLNFFMITFIFFGRSSPSFWLSWAVFMAGVAQLVWLYWSCYKQGFAFPLKKPTLTPNTKSFLRLLAPGLMGAGVVQINLLVDSMFASFLPEGAVSFLFYADRLNQLPLGVIGIAISTALLPALTKKIQLGQWKEAREAQKKAIELSLFLTCPAACGLMVLAYPIISILFVRGEFSVADAVETSKTLFAFALGLPAYVMIKILSTIFFAHKNTKTPLKIAMCGVIMNAVLNLLLREAFAHVGIALATALSSWMTVGLLGGLLYKKQMLFGFRGFGIITLKILVSCALLSVFLFYCSPLILESPIFLPIAIGGGTFLFSIASFSFRIFRLSDIQSLLSRGKWTRKLK